MGTEEPEAIRGLGIDFCVCDEFASWLNGKEVWEAIIWPTLADRNGRALFIGTPAGHNWAYDLYLMGQNPDKQAWASWRYSSLDGGRVTEDFLEGVKAISHPKFFRQEYEASFESVFGAVYSMFGPHNIDNTIEDRGGDLHIGIDFNVHPMSAVVAQKVIDEVQVLDAIELHESNTEKLAAYLKVKYADRRLIGHPDPSGQFRTSKGKTDWQILEKYNIKCKGPNAQPPVNDRINNVESNLRTADDTTRLKIHPRATALIKSLEGQVYNDSGEPDKSGGLDHMNDALGYMLWNVSNLFKKSLAVIENPLLV